MDYDQIIQDAINALNDTDQIYVSVSDVIGKKIDKGTDLDLVWRKKKKMLFSSELFEEHSSDSYIKLTDIGWAVMSDYNGVYKDYKESLKPISKRLQKASAISNIILGVLILLQTALMFRSCSRESRLEEQSNDIQLLKEQLSEIKGLLKE